MRSNYEQMLESLEIPPEKAAVIDRAREMQAGGWHALEEMTEAELDAFESEVDAAYVWQQGAHGRMGSNLPIHPHNQTRLDAMSAVTAERSRRREEHNRRVNEINARAAHIRQAAEHARAAVSELEAAHAIGPVGGPWPIGETPRLDVAGASDGELRSTADACRAILNEPYNESMAEWAAAIGQIKGEPAQVIRDELAERAQRAADRRGDSHALLALILAEQEKRERAEADTRQTPEAMERRIAELEKQMAERLTAAGPLPI